MRVPVKEIGPQGYNHLGKERNPHEREDLEKHGFITSVIEARVKTGCLRGHRIMPLQLGPVSVTRASIQTPRLKRYLPVGEMEC